MTPFRFRNRRRRYAGFLLVDALVATFVGSFVLVSVLGLTVSSMVATQVAQQNTVACNCARQILENIRLHQGAVITDGTYTDATVFGPVPELASLNTGTASVYVATSGASKIVAITVSWQVSGNTQRTKSRKFATLISPRGVAK